MLHTAPVPLAIVQNTAGLSASLAFASNQGGGNTNVVGVVATVALPTVTDSQGNSYTQISSSAAGQNSQLLGIYVAKNINPGANTVSLSGGTIQTVFAVEVSGLGASPLVDATPAVTSGTASVPAGSITAAFANEFLFALTGTNTAQGSCTGFTFLNAPSANGADAGLIAIASGTYTVTFNAQARWNLLLAGIQKNP